MFLKYKNKGQFLELPIVGTTQPNRVAAAYSSSPHPELARWGLFEVCNDAKAVPEVG